MSDYMWNLSKEIYEGKQRALAEGDEVVAKQVGKGKDILSILSVSVCSWARIIPRLMVC